MRNPLLLVVTSLLAIILPMKAIGAACPIPIFQPLRSLQEGLQNVMGGRFLCSSITPDEVEDYARHCPFHPATPITTSDDLGGLAAGMFYQSLARNSHRQAICHVKFFDTYTADAGHRSSLDQAAAAGFEKVKGKLATLLKQRTAGVNFMKTFDDPRYDDKAMFSLAAEGREHAKAEIVAVDASIARLMLQVPMGYDPDVAGAMTAMGASGKFNTAGFEAGMKKARGKYVATADYYAAKYSVQPDVKGGSYCLGLDFKNLASQTGETKQWIDKLPQKTAQERDLHDKLACRLGATYDRGHKVVDNTLALASYGGMLIPGGAEAEGAAWAIAAGVFRATSAVDTVMSVNHLRQMCYPPEAFTSSDVNACDPEKDFQRTIKERSLLACGEVVAEIGGAGYTLGKGLLPRLPNKKSGGE